MIQRFGLTIIMIMAAASAHAAVAPAPSSIPYQGHLTDAAGVDIDDSLAVEVRLYDSLIAGIGQPISNEHVLYAEQHPAVAIQNGRFAIAVGEGTPLSASWSGLPVASLIEKDAVYVELWIDGERLSPRQRLGAVPAAIRADTAKLADEVLDLGTISPDMMPAYNAGRITTGAFGDDQIPDLSASLFSGTLDSARIPTLHPEDFAAMGQLDVSLFGALNASLISDGLLGVERFEPASIMAFGDYVIATGTLTHGQHLHLPSEFDPAECSYVLSGTETVGAVEGIDQWDMYLDPNTGNLFCQIYESYEETNHKETQTCNAHYLAVCMKKGTPQ